MLLFPALRSAAAGQRQDTHSAAKAASHRSSRAVVVDGVRYSLVECSNETAALSCKVTLTNLNQGDYRTVWYPAKSYLVDSSGKHVGATAIDAGRQPPPDGEIDFPIYHPVIDVRFVGFHPTTRTLPTVQVVGDDGQPFRLQFSNIPVR